MPLFERWMNKLRRFVGTDPLKFLIAFQKSIKGEKLETLLNELGFLGMKLIDWWIAFTMSQYYRRYSGKDGLPSSGLQGDLASSAGVSEWGAAIQTIRKSACRSAQ